MAAEPGQPGSAPRAAYLDNARLLLITLVVVGHFVEPFIWSSPATRAVYVWIYAFHMPLFAALSGRLSSAKRGELDRPLLRLLVPYAGFQLLWIGWDRWVLGGQFPLTLTRPYWAMWFLLSLCVWRVVLPYLPPLRWTLPVSVALAVAAGWSELIGYPLSLSRTLVFLPFFLLGHATRNHELEALRRWRAPAAAAIVVTLAGAFVGWQSLDPQMFYGGVAYAKLGLGALEGGAQRLALLLAAVLLGASVLAWVPRRTLGITPLGERTLTVYLLHAFVMKTLERAGTFQRFDLPWAWAAFAIALTFALSWRPLHAALEPVFTLGSRPKQAATVRGGLPGRAAG